MRTLRGRRAGRQQGAADRKTGRLLGDVQVAQRDRQVRELRRLQLEAAVNAISLNGITLRVDEFVVRIEREAAVTRINVAGRRVQDEKAVSLNGQI